MKQGHTKREIFADMGSGLATNMSLQGRLLLGGNPNQQQISTYSTANINHDVERYQNAVSISNTTNITHRSSVHRWNAARCLQEQVDAARGVEHTRRLAKSRGITARFTRRSMMKDLQG